MAMLDSTGGDMTTKQLLRDFTDKLPDDISLADVIERLQILESIQQGQADIAARRFVTHEELGREMKSWNSTSSGRTVPAPN